MLYVLRSAIARRESLPPLRARPELRKATDQMLWAYAAAAACLDGFPAHDDSLGVVVGSGQGELETTKEYYKWLARENSPRPFLFQNSLHHSTTGMLSLALQIRGAAVTVSDHFFSAESALDLAGTLLSSGQCQSCLVVGVDTLVPELAPGVRARYPADLELGEGAAALLVTDEVGLQALGGTWDFAIERVELLPTGAEGETPRAGYYDSNALANLIERRDSHQVTLLKPNGSASRFQLRTPR